MISTVPTQHHKRIHEYLQPSLVKQCLSSVILILNISSLSVFMVAVILGKKKTKTKRSKISAWTGFFQARKPPWQEAELPGSPPGQADLHEAPPHLQESSDQTPSTLVHRELEPDPGVVCHLLFYRLFQEEPGNNERLARVQAARDGGVEMLAQTPAPLVYRCGSCPWLSGACLVNDLQWWTCFQP